jgi:hypothetical protein
MSSSTMWARLGSRFLVMLSLSCGATQSWAAMWVTPGSPNAGDYIVSWNTNSAGCSWEDVYPPYGYYVYICNTLEEKAGTGGWLPVSASGNSASFSGRPPDSYQYRLLISVDGGAPTQVEWLPEVIVSSEPVINVTRRKCVANGSNACDGPYALKTDMIDSGLLGSLPFGALIISTSDSQPISAFLTVCSDSGVKSACVLSDNIGLKDLDNRLFARAAQIDPIDIPPGVATSGIQGGPNWELVSGNVQGQLAFTGASSYSIWHGLWTLSLNIVYMDFVDSRDGSVHRVWINDEITVKFSDGSTAKMRLEGPAAAGGLFFKLVEGSERDANGDPVTGPPPIAANPIGNTGIDLSFVFNGTDYLASQLVFYLCVTTTYHYQSGLLTVVRREHVCPQ